jgi:hypothetical protein
VFTDELLYTHIFPTYLLKRPRYNKVAVIMSIPSAQVFVSTTLVQQRKLRTLKEMAGSKTEKRLHNIIQMRLLMPKSQ